LGTSVIRVIETETAIIGGGQAEVPLVRHKVALIERCHLGGSCVNFSSWAMAATPAAGSFPAPCSRTRSWVALG
jgi:hypothetical protein